MKDSRQGERITSLEELAALAQAKRSVLMGRNPRPAAWVLNMTGGCLLRFFREGLYAYKKPKPLPKNFRKLDQPNTGEGEE